MSKIFVTQPSMPPIEEYIDMLKPLWENKILTNMGEYHKLLEINLKQYLNVDNLSLMVNGHMALELVIQAMNFPIGSEVITTPYTFISTTHAIIRNQLKPVFCDIKLKDCTIDEKKIEELITENTVAILPTHVYGNICAVEEIEKIANKYNLKVIYDAAHAFGETYKEIGVANLGDASIFSFHATKVYNTIEGGAVSFKDPTLYDILYNLKNFGIRSEELVTQIGANAKMNEFCAAMGLCNLKYIDREILLRKEKIAEYKSRLRDNRNITFLDENKDIKYNYGYLPIIIENGKRDEVYDVLREEGVYTRKYFYPITSDQACFKNKYKKINLKNARDMASKILILPISSQIAIKDIKRICEILKKSI